MCFCLWEVWFIWPVDLEFDNFFCFLVVWGCSSSFDGVDAEVVCEDSWSSSYRFFDHVLLEKAEQNGWGPFLGIGLLLFLISLLVITQFEMWVLLREFNGDFYVWYMQMLQNTVIPEAPMFKPEFPPQGLVYYYFFTIFFCLIVFLEETFVPWWWVFHVLMFKLWILIQYVKRQLLIVLHFAM